MLTKKRVLAVETETTVGTAESLIPADAAMNVYDPVIQPDIEVIQRPNPSGFGQRAAQFGARKGTATFRTFLEGDGAGGVPYWASELLPACGWVNSSGTFSPITGSPGADGITTLTIGCYVDGVFRRIHGAMGTWTTEVLAGGICAFNWTFMGIFSEPTDVAILSPTYPTNQALRVDAGTLTLGGSAIGCANSVQIDAGNNVVMRPCVANETGVFSGIVTERNPTATLDPEAVLAATNNTHNKWLSGTEEAFSLSFDNGTDLITIAGPKFQRNNIQEADREGIVIDQTTGQFNVNSGDDSLTITFAASA